MRYLVIISAHFRSIYRDQMTCTFLYNKACIMPRRCIAAGCNTASGQGYSLHEFPRDDGARLKWARAVKLHRVGWKGRTDASFLCSNAHFEPDCFITEGV